MRSISYAVVFAFVLVDALLPTVAALPLSPSINDVALLQPSNASLGSAELITFTKLVLAVDNLGQDIPKAEVEDTLRGADRAIQYEVEAHPEQQIPNDDFSYRRKDGNMLIFMIANVGEEITWNQLSRVLHALHRFMTGGVGMPEAHYQALDFEIRTLSHKTVGFGVVRYSPPDLQKAQKRAWLPPSSSIEHESDLQMPTLVNGKKRAANSTTVLSTYAEYPRPNMPVTPIIIHLGTSIPSFELVVGLTNALRRRTHANDTSPQLSGTAASLPNTNSYGRVLYSGPTSPDLEVYFHYYGDAVSPSYITALFNQALLNFPISEDLVPGTSFHRRTPYSDTDVGTSININWRPSYRMTYNTLHRVLLGLQRYTNGDDDKRQNLQDVGSEMTAHGPGIGSGILWYVSGKVPLGKPGVDARAGPNENILLLPGSPNSTLPERYNSSLWRFDAPYPFPVHGSPITLFISHLSTPVCGIGMELFDLLVAISKEIGPIVEAHPGDPITHKAYKRSEFSEQGGGLEFNVHADGNNDVSWQDLKDVIQGLDAFYSYDPETGWYRSFAARFDIDKAGKGRIGSGNVTLVGSAVA